MGAVFVIVIPTEYDEVPTPSYKSTYEADEPTSVSNGLI